MINMQEQIVEFETARLAKEKRFDESTLNGYLPEENGIISILPNKAKWYGDRCAAPTQSLLQKWLRETHKLSVEVEFDPSYKIDEDKPDEVENNWADAIYLCRIVDVSNPRNWQATSPDYQRMDGKQFTYEGALEKGLQEALKLIEL